MCPFILKATLTSRSFQSCSLPFPLESSCNVKLHPTASPQVLPPKHNGLNNLKCKMRCKS
jgi:hypothetical protein